MKNYYCDSSCVIMASTFFIYCKRKLAIKNEIRSRKASKQGAIKGRWKEERKDLRNETIILIIYLLELQC